MVVADDRETDVSARVSGFISNYCRQWSQRGGGCTEFAIDVADVGVIDVAVNDVGDDVVAAPVEILCLGELAAAVGERAEFLQRQMIKPQRLALVDALAVPRLLQQLVQ